MTSITIPQQWLISTKFPNKWIFQCSLSLPDLVKSNQAAIYFRQLITLLEHDHQLIDYHLELRHNFKENNKLDIWICFGKPNRTSKPSLTPICISCEPTHELGMISLLSEQKYTRAWLDCRARTKLILTPIRHVESLSQLIDKNGEMEAFWYDAVEFINKESNQLEQDYPIMVLNHGTYRNHAHLHLKITFTSDIWNKTIALRYKEKIDKIKQLLENTTIVEDCLGQRYLKKKDKHCKIAHIDNDNINQDDKSQASISYT